MEKSTRTTLSGPASADRAGGRGRSRVPGVGGLLGAAKGVSALLLLLAGATSTGCATYRQYLAWCKEHPIECQAGEERAKEENRQRTRDHYYRYHEDCCCDDD